MIELNSSSMSRAEMTAAVSRAVMRWQDATQAYDEAVGERLGLIAAERYCLGLLYAGPQSAGAV
ncbi:MAG: MarR family transcriptional regulator, partial [Mesorhizobium sp.]